MIIDETTTNDVAALQRVLQVTDLFPPDLLPDMLSAGTGEDAIWLTCRRDEADEPIGFLYAVPERLAEGTWNMLAIAVLPEAQNGGAGRCLTEALEKRLRDRGARILLADTSGLADFEATRTFYRARGYEEEARVRDFWAEGDDKVTFRKAL